MCVKSIYIYYISIYILIYIRIILYNYSLLYYKSIIYLKKWHFITYSRSFITMLL